MTDIIVTGPNGEKIEGELGETGNSFFTLKSPSSGHTSAAFYKSAGWSYEEKLAEGWYEASYFPVSPRSGFDPYYVDENGQIFLMGRDGTRLSAESTKSADLIPLGRDV